MLRMKWGIQKCPQNGEKSSTPPPPPPDPPSPGTELQTPRGSTFSPHLVHPQPAIQPLRDHSREYLGGLTFGVKGSACDIWLGIWPSPRPPRQSQVAWYAFEEPLLRGRADSYQSARGANCMQGQKITFSATIQRDAGERLCDLVEPSERFAVFNTVGCSDLK